MEYFWLKQDNRIENIVMISGLINKVNLAEIHTGNLASVPELTLFSTTISSEHNIYADALSEQLFMVKKEVFDVLKLMSHKLDYKRICIMDSENRKSEYYYIPSLEIVEAKCKIESSIDYRVDDKLVIGNNTDLARKNSFFILANGKLRAVVSLPLAEALLRRKFEGIRLSRVEFGKL